VERCFAELVRLFFAVELPGAARAVLGRLRGEDGDYRWVDPSLMHVTLAFLGEQPEEQLSLLERIGTEAAHAPGGTLRLGQAGSFGPKRAPRVLWVDLGGDSDALLGLHKRLAAGLAANGFPVEEREFRAHITLARRRETARGGPPAGWPPNVDHAAFAMDALTLMQSRLSPRGATYTSLLQFRLG
jgi:RNA 2',3'-cyclic 3'-phosphodiesterase